MSPPEPSPSEHERPDADERGASDQASALGQFIREQRNAAHLSLRALADKAGVSNPYLSQIERGLHEPSVRVLSSIANALNVSAETLLRQAGALGPDEASAANPTVTAINQDPLLTPEQRQELLAVYQAFTASSGP
ncbi:MAG: helix-turn-helix transcriptional regulator [Acidimicrobiales bacterium]|nr:helix-turn-helix transcriptional regulator [Acidimicrobiales bacterium]